MYTVTPCEDTSDTLRQLKKDQFLKAFKRCGNVLKAATQVDMARDTHNHWLESDPAYEERFNKAKQFAAHVLEEELFRRAHDGVPEPVYQGGVQVGIVQKFSDTLLMFQIKRWKPESRDTFKLQHTGPADGPIQHALDVTKFTEEQLSAVEQLYAVASGEAPDDPPAPIVDRSQ